MKKSKGKAVVILLVEGDPKENVLETYNFDALKNFKETISLGTAGFLLKPSAKHISLLISILGFAKTFEKDPLFSQEKIDYTKEIVKFYEKRESLPHFLEEDTMTEIRYIEEPLNYAAIANQTKGLVITFNNENALFCKKICLDYYYPENKNQEFGKVLENALLQDYELIIFDLNEQDFEKPEFLKTLQRYNDEILADLHDNLAYYCLFKPISEQELIINSHKNAISMDNPLKEKILKIIPRQTYEYLNGNLYQDMQEKELVFGYLYEKVGCRMDRIQSFNSIIKENGLAGNGITNSHIFLREITFRLGKLPKFGA